MELIELDNYTTEQELRNNENRDDDVNHLC